MRIAIMQPYFLPYIGYFQLMASVDTFVVYDNIKYTKKGWINRNRIQNRGVESLISLPLKKDSDFLDVGARELSSSFDRAKLCHQIVGAYQRAPYFREVMPLLEKIIMNSESNLFFYIYKSIVLICDFLGVKTNILVSSVIPANHNLKSQERVLDICRELNAECYINPPGGVALYSSQDFAANGVELKFIQPKSWIYSHSEADFIPWLSIVDVMMFNSRDEVVQRLKTGYELN